MKQSEIVLSSIKKSSASDNIDTAQVSNLEESKVNHVQAVNKLVAQIREKKATYHKLQKQHSANRLRLEELNTSSIKLVNNLEMLKSELAKHNLRLYLRNWVAEFLFDVRQHIGLKREPVLYAAIKGTGELSFSTLIFSTLKFLVTSTKQTAEEIIYLYIKLYEEIGNAYMEEFKICESLLAKLNKATIKETMESLRNEIQPLDKPGIRIATAIQNSDETIVNLARILQHYEEINEVLEQQISLSSLSTNKLENDLDKLNSKNQRFNLELNSIIEKNEERNDVFLKRIIVQGVELFPKQLEVFFVCIKNVRQLASAYEEIKDALKETTFSNNQISPLSLEEQRFINRRLSNLTELFNESKRVHHLLNEYYKKGNRFCKQELDEGLRSFFMQVLSKYQDVLKKNPWRAKETEDKNMHNRPSVADEEDKSENKFMPFH